MQWFPLIGLSIGITSSTLAFWSAEGHDASGALAWQAMYVTGMAAPLLALLAGLAEDREKANRYGGTDIRPVSPYAIRAARIGVLIVVSALFHLMNFGSSWALTILDGREGANSPSCFRWASVYVQHFDALYFQPGCTVFLYSNDLISGGGVSSSRNSFI